MPRNNGNKRDRNTPHWVKASNHGAFKRETDRQCADMMKMASAVHDLINPFGAGFILIRKRGQR